MIEKRRDWLLKKPCTEAMEYGAFCAQFPEMLPDQKKLIDHCVVELNYPSTDHTLQYLVADANNMDFEYVVFNPGAHKPLWFRQTDEDVADRGELKAFLDDAATLETQDDIFDVEELYTFLRDEIPAYFDGEEPDKKRQLLRRIIARHLTGALGQKIGQVFDESLLSSDEAGWLLHDMLKTAAGSAKSYTPEHITQIDQILSFLARQDTTEQIGDALQAVVHWLFDRRKDRQSAPSHPVWALKALVEQHEDLMVKIARQLKVIEDHNSPEAIRFIYDDDLCVEIDEVDQTAYNGRVYRQTLRAYCALIDGDAEALKHCVNGPTHYDNTEKRNRQATHFTLSYTLDRREVDCFETLRQVGLDVLLKNAPADKRSSLRQQIIKWDQDEGVLDHKASGHLAALSV